MVIFLFDNGKEWLFRNAAGIRYPSAQAKAKLSPMQYPDPDDEDAESNCE